MKSIMSRHAYRTEETSEEAGTQGIGVHPHELENTSVDFYDCAGQIDYAGMQEVFLTGRAIFLVWDVQKFSNLSPNRLDEVINCSLVVI